MLDSGILEGLTSAAVHIELISGGDRQLLTEEHRVAIITATAARRSVSDRTSQNVRPVVFGPSYTRSCVEEVTWREEEEEESQSLLIANNDGGVATTSQSGITRFIFLTFVHYSLYVYNHRVPTSYRKASCGL